MGAVHVSLLMKMFSFTASLPQAVVSTLGLGLSSDASESESNFAYDADDASLAATSQIPPNGSNIMFYSNPKLDALYVQQESTADPTQRQQSFNQIHQIYLTDFPFITLYSPVDVAMNKVGTHNYTPGPEGASETVNNWEWWCDGGKC